MRDEIGVGAPIGLSRRGIPYSRGERNESVFHRHCLRALVPKWDFAGLPVPKAQAACRVGMCFRGKVGRACDFPKLFKIKR
jgi:hypothetical protein